MNKKVTKADKNKIPPGAVVAQREFDNFALRIANDDALTQTEKQLLVAIFRNNCAIAVAARQVGVDQSLHNQALKLKPKYKKYFTECQKYLVDFAYSKLLENVKRGDMKAIIYLLDAQGKELGFGKTEEKTSQVIQVNIGDQKNTVSVDSIEYEEANVIDDLVIAIEPPDSPETIELPEPPKKSSPRHANDSVRQKGLKRASKFRPKNK